MSAGQEFEFIQWARMQAAGHRRLALGIGEDAAVVTFPRPADCLFAVDVLMEGVHFRFPPATPRLAGRKALAVNLSDIAAMAGRPLAAVVGAVFPRGRGIDFAREVQLGIQELADEFEVALAGGDTNTWDGPLVLSITVLGETTARGPVRRDGARPGDWILATGSFGGSLAGRHLTFQPRVEEALRLHEAADLHAMIDVSDGLVADLHHLLEASRVGAMLEADAIPISEAARTMPGGRTPLERALGDGEDFELIFTVSSDDGRRLLDHPPIGVPLSHIGEVVNEAGCRLRDAAGRVVPLPPAGWQHAF